MQPESINAQIGHGMTAATSVVSHTLVGLAMGYGLDYLCGTLPIFLLVFMFLGFCSALRQLYRLWQRQIAGVDVQSNIDDPGKTQ